MAPHVFFLRYNIGMGTGSGKKLAKREAGENPARSRRCMGETASKPRFRRREVHWEAPGRAMRSKNPSQKTCLCAKTRGDVFPNFYGRWKGVEIGHVCQNQEA